MTSRTKLLCAVAIVVGLLEFVNQSWTVRRIQKENGQLRHSLAEESISTGATSSATPSELERLRQATAGIHRLRNTVSQKHRDQAEIELLRRENEQLRAPKAPASTPAPSGPSAYSLFMAPDVRDKSE